MESLLCMTRSFSLFLLNYWLWRIKSATLRGDSIINDTLFVSHRIYHFSTWHILSLLVSMWPSVIISQKRQMSSLQHPTSSNQTVRQGARPDKCAEHCRRCPESTFPSLVWQGWGWLLSLCGVISVPLLSLHQHEEISSLKFECVP